MSASVRIPVRSPYPGIQFWARYFLRLFIGSRAQDGRLEVLAPRIGKIDMMSEKQFRVTHYERDPVNGPGQYVTRHHNLEGNPFVVFCMNKECEHFHERPTALPHWSDECREFLGVMRCPACDAPVTRPPRD